MKNKVLLAFAILLCVFLNVACDRVTKNIARDQLMNKPPISLLAGTFVLTYIENDGAFLGSFGGLPNELKAVVLIIIPILACIAALIYIFVSKDLSFVERMLLASVIGGGIGNLIDRIAVGSVTDFMNFGIGQLRTGILNVADMSITFGIIAFFILRMIRDSKDSKAKKETAGE